MEDFVENIRDGLRDKSPNMREEVLKFASLFVQKKDHKNITLLRSIAEKVIPMTEDGVVKVRNQALDLLIKFKVTHGMKFFGDKVRLLEPKKLQTLELAKPLVPQEVVEADEFTVTHHHQRQHDHLDPQ